MGTSATFSARESEFGSVFSAALRAYKRGDYQECVNSLTNFSDRRWRAQSEILMSRALIRLDRRTEALEHARSATTDAKDSETMSIAHALQGYLHRIKGDKSDAENAFAKAKDLLSKSKSNGSAAVDYLEALSFWQANDTEAAEDCVERALDTASGFEAAQLLQLRGWIEVRKENYRTATEDFLDALDLLAESDDPDPHLHARLIHGVAIIASETIDLRLGDFVTERYHAFQWSSGFSNERSKTLTCLRFLALLRNDRKLAWKLSRAALAIAPDHSSKAIAATNAAALSRLVGDDFASGMEFDEAWQAITSADWANANEEMRVALSNFAIEASELKPTEARKALTRYASQTGKPDSRNALHADRRVRAFEEMAAGRVSEILDEAQDEAISHYKRSLEIWNALDYRMRAALVSKHLHRLTGEEQYLETVEFALRRAPKAWFGDVSGDDIDNVSFDLVGKLTPAQRGVLQELFTGLKAQQIADQLGISIYTVHNHTRKIFSIFDVHTKAELLVRCAQLKITGESVAGTADERRRPGPSLKQRARN